VTREELGAASARTAREAFLRRRAEPIVYLVAYASLYALWVVTGGAFFISSNLWQLLPMRPLVEDFAGSLLDLHSQPPVLNALFGGALKVALATGWRAEAILSPVFFLVGAGMVVALAALAARVMPVAATARRASLAIFVLNPFLYGSVTFFYYTPLETLFLLLSALFAFRYFEVPTWRRLSAALLPAVLLVYTRSLFHPLWCVGFMTVLLGRKREAWHIRSLTAAAVALALLLAWPTKNLVRFGMFGYSSWAGYSFARGLPLEPGPAIQVFDRSPGEPVARAGSNKVRAMVPAEFNDRPVLAAVAKPNGAPNWNHYAVIPLFRELAATAAGFAREHPLVLAQRTLHYYLNGFSIYEARWAYDGSLGIEVDGAPSLWVEGYETVVIWPFRAFDPRRTALTTGFALLFPVLLCVPVLVLALRRQNWGATERTVAVMLFSVVWVLALALLVDGKEANRMRFSTEPFLFLAFAWGATAAHGRAGTWCRRRAVNGSTALPAHHLPESGARRH
jgi:hypothetical protein